LAEVIHIACVQISGKCDEPQMNRAITNSVIVTATGGIEHAKANDEGRKPS
jgi:hypothetical protein